MNRESLRKQIEEYHKEEMRKLIKKKKKIFKKYFDTISEFELIDTRLRGIDIYDAQRFAFKEMELLIKNFKSYGLTEKEACLLILNTCLIELEILEKEGSVEV